MSKIRGTPRESSVRDGQCIPRYPNSSVLGDQVNLRGISWKNTKRTRLLIALLLKILQIRPFRVVGIFRREACASCQIFPSVIHTGRAFRLSQVVDRLQLRAAKVLQLEHGEPYHYLSCSDINSHLNSSSVSRKSIVMLCQYPIFVGRCVHEMQRLFDQNIAC